MSRLYLITGFLGAGKTTFLKQFIRLFAGQKIQLIVNEYGREGVDGALLSELHAYLHEISGGSVFCSCRLDQFEKILRESAEIRPDVILVEASGLSDPTGVRKLFSQTDRYSHIEYAGAVCLIDAVRFPKQYATARACTKQLAAGDAAVVNKADLASPGQLEATLSLIRGQRPDMPVFETAFGQIPAGLADALAGAKKITGGDLPLTADLTARSLSVAVSPEITPAALAKFIELFAEYTYRIKGLILTDSGIFLADCVGNAVSVTPYEGQIPDSVSVGTLTVLSGSGMPALKAVSDACRLYPMCAVK